MRGRGFLVLVFIATDAFAHNALPEFFYEEISIRNFRETNYVRNYYKGNMFRSERSLDNSIMIYDLEKGEVLIIDTKKKEYRILPLERFMKDLSDKINSFVRLGKVFIGKMKITFTGEFTNIMGYKCAKLVDNFGGYYYVTTDLAYIKTNFDSKLLQKSGYRYNYENFARLFALDELSLDEKSKEYFFRGYFLERMVVMRTMFLVETNFSFVKRIEFRVDDSVFYPDLLGYRKVNY